MKRVFELRLEHIAIAFAAALLLMMLVMMKPSVHYVPTYHQTVTNTSTMQWSCDTASWKGWWR